MDQHQVYVAQVALATSAPDPDHLRHQRYKNYLSACINWRLIFIDDHAFAEVINKLEAVARRAAQQITLTVVEELPVG